MERFLNAARLIFCGRSQRAFYIQFLVWGVAAIGIAVLWIELKPLIFDDSVYSIRLENVLICDPPPWISNDFVADALKNLPLDRKLETLSALDSDIKNVLKVAFNAHPWVEQVEKIDVFYPAQVRIRLKFRQPVLILDPDISIIKDFQNLLLERSYFNEDFLNNLNMSALLEKESNSKPYVVDETGRRLPDEYLRNNVKAYDELPILYGIYWEDTKTPGSRLDDFTTDSALFASFLESSGALEKYEIEQIYMLRKYGQTRGVYFLRAKNGSICLWGNFALDQETRVDQTYSGERNTPKWEEAKAKLFKEQSEKLKRWNVAYNDALKNLSETSSKESQAEVYFSVASDEETLK